MKVVSIIVPVYNTAAYVARCIESVQAQTYPNWELILADDGSTDDSLAICQQYATQDNRIRVLSLPHRKQAAARNSAFQYAIGEYLMYVDADDYILPDCLEKTVHAIGDKDVLQFQSRSFYRLVSACMRLYRTAYIRQAQILFPEGVYYEDVYFSIQLWLSHPRYTILPYKGYVYTTNVGSTTAQVHTQDKAQLWVWLRLMLKKANSPKDRAILLYTTLRLKVHFWKVR